MCYRTVRGRVTPSEQVKQLCNMTVACAFVVGTEQVADKLVWWVPLYSVAKVAATGWLLHPRADGGMQVMGVVLRQRSTATSRS